MRDLALRLASLASLTFAPALLVQGALLRRRIPRLPEAEGPREGEVPGASPPVRVLLLGESTAAGVGAKTHVEGLAGQLGRALARDTGRGVRWRVLARTGATARIVREELLAPAPDTEADVAVLVLGVNDVLALGSVARWRRDLGALIAAVRGRCGDVPVVLAAVPPMGAFPALPRPLKDVLALRAQVLDRAALRLAASLRRVRHVPMPSFAGEDAAAFFCADGFHPGTAGYRAWGDVLGGAAAGFAPEV